MPTRPVVTVHRQSHRVLVALCASLAQYCLANPVGTLEGPTLAWAQAKCWGPGRLRITGRGCFSLDQFCDNHLWRIKDYFCAASEAMWRDWYGAT